MRFYRIKQISENEFIPQTKTLFDFWVGIGRHDEFDVWYSESAQNLYCKVSMIEKAKQVIENFKQHKKNKYPKYIKM